MEADHIKLSSRYHESMCACRWECAYCTSCINVEGRAEKEIHREIVLSKKCEDFVVDPCAYWLLLDGREGTCLGKNLNVLHHT